jgi:hypothetical protein
MQAEAAMRRMAKRARPQHHQNRQPAQFSLGRHAIGRIGAALIALGSRMEQVERSGLSPVSPVSQVSTANHNR